MLKLPVYLDNNATTPMDPRVLEAMIPYFTEHFGNAASRNHPFGWEAEEAVDYAREQVAKLIGADPKEIIFTSGATEGDNLAIKGVFEMYATKGNHIITVTTEHKAVLDTCKHLERAGAEVTYLEVQPDGLIDLKELEAAIKPTTILIAIMYANNEIGTIQLYDKALTSCKKIGSYDEEEFALEMKIAQKRVLDTEKNSKRILQGIDSLYATLSLELDDSDNALNLVLKSIQVSLLENPPEDLKPLSQIDAIFSKSMDDVKGISLEQEVNKIWSNGDYGHLCLAYFGVGAGYCHCASARGWRCVRRIFLCQSHS